MTALAIAVAFASGFAVDVLAVLWTRSVVLRNARTAVVYSMLLGAAQVAGIGSAVRDWRLAPFFIVGYGLGSAVAIWATRKTVPRW